MSKLNISIDDVSPHPMSSLDVIRQCYRVLDEFPDCKFTLFVPTAYWRQTGTAATAHPLNISDDLEFCVALKSLPSESFEICYHGHHHGIPGISNNDEFKSLDYKGALGIIDEMIKEVTKANLFNVFKPIIRPPAWRLSPESFSAFEDRGINIFALSQDAYAMNTYGRAYEGRRVVFYKCAPPAKPLMLFEKTEIVYHACNWDVNYFSDAFTTDLIQFLRRHKDEIEFTFIEGLL